MLRSLELSGYPIIHACRGIILFGSSEERLERKIKELNAVKGEYRSAIEEAERSLKRKEIDQLHFEHIRERNEEHIERINDKIRDVRERLHEMRTK